MKRRSSVDRREQILEVALALFTQHGMASVSTRQIARAVGISQPSLYAHFPSADAIAAELCARGFQALHDRFAEVLEEPGTPLARLARLGRAYIEFGLANPDVYRIAFMIEQPRDRPCPAGELPSDPGLDEGLRTFGVLRQVVAEVLGRNDTEAGHGGADLLGQRPRAGLAAAGTRPLSLGQARTADHHPPAPDQRRDLTTDRTLTGPGTRMARWHHGSGLRMAAWTGGDRGRGRLRSRSIGV